MAGGEQERHRSDKVSSKSNEKSTKKSVSSTATSKQRSSYFGPLTTLLLFSLAMLVLPLGTYFWIRNYLVDSTTIGAMGAIVVVQIIIAAYIYKAWSDENAEHKSQEKEQTKKKR